MKNGTNAVSYVNELEEAFSHVRNPEEAVMMKKYMKDKFPFLGIKAPQRKQVQKEWFREIKSSGLHHWDIVSRLWEKPEREYHYVALDFLQKVPSKAIEKDDYKILEDLILTNTWWDSVDSIAANYVGKYFREYPEMIEPVIGKWRNADNFWLKRTCLIFQLKYKDNTDFKLLKSLILQYQNDREFFIQKAIGWALRQDSKFHPHEVREFVSGIELSRVAEREAEKYI